MPEHLIDSAQRNAIHLTHEQQTKMWGILREFSRQSSAKATWTWAEQCLLSNQMMPFWLCNVPGCFEHLIERLLEGQGGKGPVECHIKESMG